jgi:aminoglycoside/choline kinase family phosphotransferase
MNHLQSERGTNMVWQLKRDLESFFNNSEFNLIQIDSGASVRKYFRISFEASLYFPTRDVILMAVPLDKIEMADDYLNISYYLQRQNIPQPRIFEMQREKGWIFLEPAEGEQLNNYLKQYSDLILTIYPRLVDFLLLLQSRAVFEGHCPAFSRFFDQSKYMYEFNFHVKEQVIHHYFNHTLSRAENQIFSEFSGEISQYLESTYPVFVHRDFQSSNIFYREKNGEDSFQIIDFQDARSGSYTYDLVSLLWDSYVDIPDKLRKELIDQFYQKNDLFRKHCSPDEYYRLIDYQIIQRKLHDAGAFIYTYRLLNNQQFLKFITSALDMTISVLNRYPAFMEISQLLQRLMSLPEK